MKISHWNIFLSAVFFIVFAVVIFIGLHYKTSQTKAALQEKHSQIAGELTHALEVLIESKKNSTLTIALSLAQNPLFKQAILEKNNVHDTLATVSFKLKENTDFKNVWIQLVDAQGVAIARSWTDTAGDNLKNIRLDVATMINNPQVSSYISVGKYDLTFKAMTPFYDASEKFVGFLEVITHFNSITNTLKDEGVESVILVDKAYRKQITHPFTENFIGEYYLANEPEHILVEYLKAQGVENSISYTNNHAVNDQYLKVNYTLFGLDAKPMAYILMFKKTQDINTDSIKSKNFIIELMMIFTILIVGFILFLLVKQEPQKSDVKGENIKYFLIFFSIFTSVTFAFYLLLNTYKMSERESFLKSYNANIEKDYAIINKKYEIIANTMFETTLNNPAVLALMKKAYTDKKDAARKELYELLKVKYEYFKSYDIRQLHFHLKNNESFLRFHRLDKYGDNLTGMRATVEWVNANMQKIEGFEEGKIYNGFRHVFPLFFADTDHEQTHVGSVEVSFSAYALANDFAQSHGAKVAFLVSKDIADKKLFREEKSNYVSSEFESFYYEKSVKKRFQATLRDIQIEKISPKDLRFINSKIFEGKTLSLSSQDGNTLFTVLPLYNPVSKKVVAAIILQIDNRVLEKQNELFILIFSIGTILILLTIIFVFREFTLKIKFLNLSIKTQHILDTQKSMVIITDGEKIYDANKKFLEFFGYDSLKEFQKVHPCICDLFIENAHYYSLAKVPLETNWIGFLEHIPYKDRVILINDPQGLGHSFAITFSNYETSYYIVTFTDISGTIQEQLMLANKVIHDTLTGAYNREFFDAKIVNIIEQIKSKEKFLGIIFLDIDHFKTINDTYGHNVGDSILQELVKRLLESIRSSDYLIRWGGEEFIVLISVKSLEEVESTAEHLRSMIEHHSFEDIRKLTASFGITLLLNDEPIKTAIERADKALYISKDNGRNRVTKL